MKLELCSLLRHYPFLTDIHWRVIAQTNFLLVCFWLFLWQWHAFSVPELQNFLVILEKEESERVRAVEQKYAVYRQKLQRALQQHGPWPLTCYLMTLRRERLTLWPLETPEAIQRLEPELNLSAPSTYIPKHTVHPHTDAYPFSGRIQAPPPSIHPLPEERIRGWKRRERLQGVWSASRLHE